MTDRIQIERILCPTDFSPFSTRALRHAAALARRFDARLTVLHVIPHWTPYAGGLEYLPAPLLLNPAIRQRLESDLYDFATYAIEAGVAVETLIREAEPWREILAVAGERCSDLLVMGTHGRSGIEQLLLGAVAEKVLHRAPCPVLTVCREEGRTWEAPGVIGRIVCATDLSDASDPTLRYALSLAEEYQSALTVLHVLEGVPSSDDPAYRSLPESAALLKQIEGVAREQLHQAIPPHARDWCDIRERVEHGRAHRELLRIAADESADLIVMGARRHGLVARAVLGSTSHHVVREASCPVLTVRPVAAPAGAVVLPVASVAGSLA